MEKENPEKESSAENRNRHQPPSASQDEKLLSNDALKKRKRKFAHCSDFSFERGYICG
jgi:hypothetical protein